MLVLLNLRSLLVVCSLVGFKYSGRDKIIGDTDERLLKMNEYVNENKNFHIEKVNRNYTGSLTIAHQ